MQDWNVVASVQVEGFRESFRLLSRWGEVAKTEYFNVLVGKVEDVAQFLEALRQQVEDEPGTLNFVGRVVPVTRSFPFHSADEFEAKSREAALSWTEALRWKSFHVRMRRRGFKGRLSSQVEEQRLAGVLLEAMEAAGAPGRITFEDPDAILAVETVGNRAGLSLWSREDLRRYPFLGLD